MTDEEMIYLKGCVRDEHILFHDYNYGYCKIRSVTEDGEFSEDGGFFTPDGFVVLKDCDLSDFYFVGRNLKEVYEENFSI